MEKTKTYFLFGSGIVSAFHDGGMRAACKYARNEWDWGLFVFVAGETEPHKLLAAYDGYLDWIMINEKEYKKLNSL